MATLVTDRVTFVAGIAAAIALTVSRYHGSTGEFQFRIRKLLEDGESLFGLLFRKAGLTSAATELDRIFSPINDFHYWFVCSFLLFGALPLAIAAAARVPWKTFGTGFGEWRRGLPITVILYFVMLPFVIGASFTDAFAHGYPMAGGASSSLATLLAYELFYGLYFIGWEFIYRGLLCVGLYPRIGAAVIYLHTIPFAVMHGGKPEAEAYGSILAGLALGALAVRTRSFWYGALLHTAVASTMDVAALAQTARFPTKW